MQDSNLDELLLRRQKPVNRAAPPPGVYLRPQFTSTYRPTVKCAPPFITSANQPRDRNESSVNASNTSSRCNSSPTDANNNATTVFSGFAPRFGPPLDRKSPPLNFPNDGWPFTSPLSSRRAYSINAQSCAAATFPTPHFVQTNDHNLNLQQLDPLYLAQCCQTPFNPGRDANNVIPCEDNSQECYFPKEQSPCCCCQTHWPNCNPQNYMNPNDNMFNSYPKNGCTPNINEMCFHSNPPIMSQSYTMPSKQQCVQDGLVANNPSPPSICSTANKDANYRCRTAPSYCQSKLRRKTKIIESNEPAVNHLSNLLEVWQNGRICDELLCNQIVEEVYEEMLRRGGILPRARAVNSNLPLSCLPCQVMQPPCHKNAKFGGSKQRCLQREKECVEKELAKYLRELMNQKSKKRDCKLRQHLDGIKKDKTQKNENQKMNDIMVNIDEVRGSECLPCKLNCKVDSCRAFNRLNKAVNKPKGICEKNCAYYGRIPRKMKKEKYNRKLADFANFIVENMSPGLDQDELTNMVHKIVKELDDNISEINACRSSSSSFISSNSSSTDCISSDDECENDSDISVITSTSSSCCNSFSDCDSNNIDAYDGKANVLIDKIGAKLGQFAKKLSKDKRCHLQPIQSSDSDY